MSGLPSLSDPPAPTRNAVVAIPATTPAASTPHTSWTRARARLAGLSVTHDPHDPVVLDARRELALARVEERVRTAVESAPPLPEDLRRRLVELIRATPADRPETEAQAA